METKIKNHKRAYNIPQLIKVSLDNEISLELESNPPGGPGEVQNLHAPDYFNNDPFKTNRV